MRKLYTEISRQTGTPDSSGRSTRFIWFLRSTASLVHRINPAVRPVKTGVPLICLLFALLAINLSAETLALQSFESLPSDTWAYTANPSPDAKRIWWGPTTEMMGGASAYQGSVYWAGWDLDNLESTLTFQTLTLPAGYSYTVSFWYFTKNLASSNDYCRYSVKYDNGSTWDNWVNVASNSNAWTAVSVNVPTGSSYLRLRLSSNTNSLSNGQI